jgi:hypothetical protein
MILNLQKNQIQLKLNAEITFLKNLLEW